MEDPRMDYLQSCVSAKWEGRDAECNSCQLCAFTLGSIPRLFVGEGDDFLEKETLRYPVPREGERFPANRRYKGEYEELRHISPNKDSDSSKPEYFLPIRLCKRKTVLQLNFELCVMDPANRPTLIR
ncbi:hypothetical protein HNY73_013515 [Argiope bruennichi]|uniref:Uncharacterized protein n=1 Tax=Argiope bruennichi TaxID=94029 RepID=A0A8T0F034_ARGBR|nr:hypothetical protein HNY73_013515 [Argiope bruennichi]